MSRLTRLVARTCVVAMLSASFVPLAGAVDDTTAPIILHTQPDVIPAESEYELKATVTDDSGVKQVQLNLRAAGDEGNFRIEQMESSLESIYIYKFGSGELKQPGYEYFISAEDEAGNVEQSGFEFDPLNLRVGPALSGAAPKPDDIAVSTTPSVVAEQQVSSKRSNVGWYLLGALAVVVLASSGGGGGGGDGGSEVTINLPTL